MTKRLPAVAIAAWLVALTIAPADAPATVEQQRARLPPPAECSSPVTGKWRALTWNEHQSSWYQYTLEVHQDAIDPSKLSGMIYIDAWTGDADTPEPPNPCRWRYQGKMDGTGRFLDGEVQFWGGPFEMTQQICGGYVAYNPDHFTGKLQPELQEFQAVNNDGGAAVNEPAVFRRIACFDDGRKDPGSAVAPPPFFPKHRKSGC
ncbi:MAG TPA: hypothetical protein VGF94_13580 [Kofleriaceae bacterium]